MASEKMFKEKVLIGSAKHPYASLSTYACHNIVTEVLSGFENKKIFSSLSSHMMESEPENNHLVLLVKAVAESYLQVRYKYSSQQFTLRQTSLKQVKSRATLNKLILFSGL